MAASARTDVVSADKSLTSRVAENDRALLRRTDSRPVQVMIKLDYDSTATYQGGVAGLAATSPSVTGQPLTGAHRARAQVRGLRGRARRTRSQGRHQGRGRRPRLRHVACARVYGGVAAVVPANQVADLARASPASSPCSPTRCSQPLTDSSAEFIGAAAVVHAARRHRRTPARASSSATSTPASGPSTRRSPTRATCPPPPGPTAPRVRLRRQPADAGERRRSCATTS